MATIGYHASHEQFSPGLLLQYAQAAESAGFSAAMCSDHFHPWCEEQGESGFSWSWLGAAMQATLVPYGVVCAPGQRYHPAIVAQAAATLAEMFPDRFWVALGSGEALNEHITGDPWPNKPDRNKRLEECVEVIRALWAGELVNHRGLVTVDNARLHTLPAHAPRVFGAAITPETAAFVGRWADGLMTVSQPRDTMQRVIDAFRDGGGSGKPMYLQIKLSYSENEEEARNGAFDQWRTNVLSSNIAAELTMPAHVSEATQYVRPEDLDSSIRISSDLQRHVDCLQQDIELGFDHLYLHNVNRGQKKFIDAFGKWVLPDLRP